MTAEPSPPRGSFGSRLRTARRAAGLSQAELAGDGLSASYVSLLESGRRTATPAVMAALAERLSTTVEALVSGPDQAEAARRRLTIAYAELALRNGEPQDALDQLEQLLDRAGAGPVDRNTGEDLWRVRRLRVRALESLGRLEPALAELEPLREQARREGRHVEHLALTVDAVRCYQEVGDVAYAIDVGEQALAEVRAWGLLGTDIHAELASSVLGAYYARGDLVRAQQMAVEALESVGAGGSSRARAAVLWNTSLLAEQRGDTAGALAMAERALASYAEGDDARSLARLRTAYGWLLLRCLPPQADEALRVLEQARAALSDVGSEVDLAYCETELARCALLLGRTGEALDLAVSALRRLGATPRLERAHSELVRARALLSLGRRDDAVAAYRDAADLLGGLDLPRQAAGAWRELADAFAELGQLEDAALAYQQALSEAGVRAAPDVRYDISDATAPG